MKPIPTIAAPILIDTVPATGHHLRITPANAERRAIAEAYGLKDVKAFVADVDLIREDRDTVLLEGHVVATIVQACVVSLEPVEQIIDEQFTVRIAAADSPKAPKPDRPGAEVHVDPDVEVPEISEDGRINVGALVLEYFALAIDPYPRAAGAEVPDSFRDAAKDESDSPFAALSKILETDR
ncbi:DUF177 domain-containing protein [Bauldia sp.]|uniref:DUF177 domain-containing protein n=1 Tax=Bauldia sp. TaxID=2575872 RepID=UPI003BA8CF25